MVTTGWLARSWRTTAWPWRVVLVVLVFGLAVINAAGVYAQLVAAHAGERGAAQWQSRPRTRLLLPRSMWQPAEWRISTDKSGRSTPRLPRLPSGAKRLPDFQPWRGSGRHVQPLLVSVRRRRALWAALKAERATVAAQGRRIETEATPIVYVAEMFGIGTDGEKAIRWLIALMVLCCDPLAIALTAATSAQRAA